MLDSDSKVFDGKTESEFLAQSIKDVAQHYGAGMFDQKTLDWANLTQCLMIVYGGRIFAIRSTPRAAPVRRPTPQQTAQQHQPGGPPQHHRTPEPFNSFNGNDPANSADIAGVGSVVLPDDHPLSPNFKPRMN